jgi:hypothetical protein
MLKERGVCLKSKRLSKSILVSAIFAVVFGLLMTFWGMGRFSEEKLLSFFLYTAMFFVLHRAMSKKWR